MLNILPTAAKDELHLRIIASMKRTSSMNAFHWHTVAWSVGDGQSGKYGRVYNNYNTVSIEMVSHTDSAGTASYSGRNDA